MSPEKRRRAYKHLYRVCPSGPHKRDWLHWWVKSYEGIHIPNVKVCPDHDAPFTAFADAFFGESSKDARVTSMFLCHGSRLFGGKTFLAGTLARVRMILKSAEVFILGGSKDQTAQMRDYIKGDGDHMKGRGWNAKRAQRSLIESETTDTVTLNGGAKTTALAASQTAVRSKHGTDLYVDELDEMDWDIFKSAMGQTYEGTRNINALTFITSTWQNPDGSMTEAFELAEEKGWGVYTWCYRETHENVGGHVTDSEVSRKKDEMTELDWLNEVELQRPESGDLIFTPEIIEVMFDSRLGEFEDTIGKDYILIPPGVGEFYHGTDWAKQRDFTVIATLLERSTGPDQLAAFCMRQKEPWPVMMEYHNQRIREYGGPSYFDVTGMGGDIIDDHMTVDSAGWEFSNVKLTHHMYSSFITACESGEYVFPEIPHLRKVMAFLTRGQVYESSRKSKKNHTPDAFVALALARKAKTEGIFELLLGRV